MTTTILLMQQLGYSIILSTLITNFPGESLFIIFIRPVTGYGFVVLQQRRGNCSKVSRRSGIVTPSSVRRHIFSLRSGNFFLQKQKALKTATIG